MLVLVLVLVLCSLSVSDVALEIPCAGARAEGMRLQDAKVLQGRNRVEVVAFLFYCFFE